MKSKFVPSGFSSRIPFVKSRKTFSSLCISTKGRPCLAKFLHVLQQSLCLIEYVKAASSRLMVKAVKITQDA